MSVSTQHPRWQVFTDEPVARYMASVATSETGHDLPIHVLDPGSGPGTLLEAFVQARAKGTESPINAVAVERDHLLAMDSSSLCLPVQVALKVHNDDFFEYYQRSSGGFSHVIMNPPYGRPERDGEEQRKIRSLNLPTHNLYAAFVAAAFNLLEDGGLLVAIVPRSILTGVLAQSLRRHILKEGWLELVTTFAGRKLAFTRDDIQQDVVIVAIRKRFNARGSNLPANLRIGKISSVTPWSYDEFAVPYDSVVRESEQAPYILVPNGESSTVSSIPILSGGLVVTTGSIVDFRVRDWLISERMIDAVPLIDATGRRGSPRFLRMHTTVRKHIYDPGVYVAMNRFSPPEQVPRAKARLIDATGEHGVAFENHVNVIHRNGRPLEYDEAEALLDALSHPSIDQQLAGLSSSTHVNAIDVRRLRRP